MMGDEDYIDEKRELRESKTSLVAGFIMPHNRIQIFKHAREIREQHFSRKLSCVKRRSKGGDGLQRARSRFHVVQVPRPPEFPRC